MDKNLVVNFILDSERVTIPELQQKFSATYAEIKEIVASLVEEKKLKLGEGLYYDVTLSEREKAARASAKLINHDPEYHYKLNLRPPVSPIDASKAMRMRPANPRDINVCLMVLWDGIGRGDVSTSYIQRTYSISFTSAYRIREWMERNDYVEPYPSGKVVITRDEFLEKFGNPGMNNDSAPYDLDAYFKTNTINLDTLDPYFKEPYEAFCAANGIRLAEKNNDDDDDDDDDDENDGLFDFSDFEFDLGDDDDDDDDEDEDSDDDDDSDDEDDDREGIIDADELESQSSFKSFLQAIHENEQKQRQLRVTEFCSDILDEDEDQVYTVGADGNKLTFRVFHIDDDACVGDNGETYKSLGEKDDAIKSAIAGNDDLCYDDGEKHELYVKTSSDNFLPSLIELFIAIDKIKSNK